MPHRGQGLHHCRGDKELDSFTPILCQADKVSFRDNPQTIFLSEIIHQDTASLLPALLFFSAHSRPHCAGGFCICNVVLEQLCEVWSQFFAHLYEPRAVSVPQVWECADSIKPALAPQSHLGDVWSRQPDTTCSKASSELHKEDFRGLGTNHLNLLIFPYSINYFLQALGHWIPTRNP